MTVETLALIAAALFFGLAVFQVALALGAPWGMVVYGGRMVGADGRLPSKWRLASGIAAVILVVFAWVILARAGVVSTGIDERYLAVGSWMVVAYMALNTAGNLASKHPIERYLFGGITLLLVVLCAIVAAAGPT